MRMLTRAPVLLLLFALVLVFVPLSFGDGGDILGGFETDAVEAAGPGTINITTLGFCLSAGRLWDATGQGCSYVAFNPQFPVTSPMGLMYYSSQMYWNDLWNSGLLYPLRE